MRMPLFFFKRFTIVFVLIVFRGMPLMFILLDSTWIQISFINCLCLLSLTYALCVFPFVEWMDNVYMVIEELSTALTVVLLIFVRLDYGKEVAGTTIVILLSGVTVITMGINIVI